MSSVRHHPKQCLLVLRILGGEGGYVTLCNEKYGTYWSQVAAAELRGSLPLLFIEFGSSPHKLLQTICVCACTAWLSGLRCCPHCSWEVQMQHTEAYQRSFNLISSNNISKDVIEWASVINVHWCESLLGILRTSLGGLKQQYTNF